MTPEEFANAEDWERETWDKQKPKAKKVEYAVIYILLTVHANIFISFFFFLLMCVHIIG